jgi:hypothetical protein
MANDAPPHLKNNSNASLKVKTMKERGVGVHSLIRNISRVEGCAGVPGCELGQVTSESIIHMDLH